MAAQALRGECRGAWKYRGAKSPLQVDVTKEPASLAPTVHGNMGGTPTSGKTQAVRNAENTSAPGLAAAGENDGALVHDNNLLGANSLLDLVDVGRQAADTAAGRVILDSPAVQLPKKTGGGLDCAHGRVPSLQGANPNSRSPPCSASVHKTGELGRNWDR